MRIGIISDIHANIVALERVLTAIGTVDTFWCLGDVVGYGPNPNECIDTLRVLPRLDVCLTGNHDWAALGHVDISDFNPEARQAALWTREHLTADSTHFLQERPEMVLREPESTLAHGSPREPIWEYITNTTEARDNFLYFDTPLCFVGHTHVPIVYQLNSQGQVIKSAVTDGTHINLHNGQRFIVNPGSVGQPRDSDPRAAYAIYDSNTGWLTFHRIGYNIATTQERMAAAHLPRRLITRLDYGW